jgi:hypothetical protein
MAVSSGKELCPLNQAGPHIESTRTRKTLQMENEKARHTRAHFIFRERERRIGGYQEDARDEEDA